MISEVIVPVRKAVPALRCVYQPIVDLHRWTVSPARSTVGYEALARVVGADGILTGPVDLTGDATQVADIDRACRLAALQGALQARLGSTGSLFVNIEPASGDFAPLSEAEQSVYDRAQRDLRVFIEVTERALLDHPAAVLKQVNRARTYGWGVAVDDVGAHPDSLALLPFIAPDVIKLDLDLVRNTPTRTQARVITAVMAHVERTGALVLAEGIEQPAHLEQALSFGATLGQGFMFGRPDLLERHRARFEAQR